MRRVPDNVFDCHRYLGLVTVTLGIVVWVGAGPMFIAPIAVLATISWKINGRQLGATDGNYVARVVGVSA